MKQNCWEFKECGRELYGRKTEELGTCPAATDASKHGMNNGTNGGRICWAVAGTLCGSTIQGTFAEKEDVCLACEFYQKVAEEEKKALFHHQQE